jgi:hypothetical protein
VPSSIKFIKERIVMRNDLLKSQRRRIGRRVTVGGKNDVIAKADGAARGRINAVLRHASADHKPLDSSGCKFRGKGSFEESVASAFVDDRFAWLRRDFRPQQPPRSSRFQPVTAATIVLDIDHGHGCGSRSIDKCSNARHRFAEGPVDFLLARKTGVIQDAALDVDHQECNLSSRHTSS